MGPTCSDLFGISVEVSGDASEKSVSVQGYSLCSVVINVIPTGTVFILEDSRAWIRPTAWAYGFAAQSPTA